MIDALLGARVGEWQIDDIVGEGGVGRIYRASRTTGFPNVAAIKLIRRDRFTASNSRALHLEAECWMTADHPYVAKLLAAGTFAGDNLDEQPYLVMEYVEGVPLDRYADQRGLNITARLELFAKVCEGVQYLHDSGIAHLDLKPANILVKADGTPKILDFGISRPLSSSPAGVSLFPHGFSVFYASPEQIRRVGVPTRAADVYSLGAVLYELLTGHRPIPVEGRTEAEQIRAVLEAEPERPSQAVLRSRPARDGRHPQTPDGLAKLRGATSANELRSLLRGDMDCVALFALRKEAERRYPTVQALLEDVRCHLRGDRIRARMRMPTYSALRLARRWPGWVVAAALFVTLVQAHWTIDLMLRTLAAPIDGQLEELAGALAEAEPVLAGQILEPLRRDPRTADLTQTLSQDLDRVREVIRKAGDLK